MPDGGTLIIQLQIGNELILVNVLLREHFIRLISRYVIITCAVVYSETLYEIPGVGLYLVNWVVLKDLKRYGGN